MMTTRPGARAHGPVPNFASYDPLDDDLAEAIIARRFGLFQECGGVLHDRPLPETRDPRSDPHDRHAVIEASARHRAKRRTIEHLVIELLLRQNVSIDQILVLTFTERAAAELRQSGSGRSSARSSALVPRGFECRCDRSGTFWRVDDARRDQLGRALSSLDGASIGTIHGFFGRVLNEHAFAGGRLFDGTLEDGRTRFGRVQDRVARSCSPGGPATPPTCSHSGSTAATKASRGLETLLYQCHSSRAGSGRRSTSAAAPPRTRH